MVWEESRVPVAGDTGDAEASPVAAVTPPIPATPPPAATAPVAHAGGNQQPIGLRERKRMRTMGEIQQAAIRLFAQQGYDATTVDQIAEAAGVSPATFFRYYPSKEAVVRTDEFDGPLLRALASRPPEESAYEAMAAAVQAVMPYLDETRDALLERARLILQTPALHAQAWEAYRASVDTFASGLAQRMGRDPPTFVQRFHLDLAPMEAAGIIKA